jgi:hypothetical protein
VHVVGQLIPEGLLVTVPEPVIVTVRLKFLGGGGGGVLPDVPPQAVKTNTQARETAKPGTRKFKIMPTSIAQNLGAKQSSWVACCWSSQKTGPAGVFEKGNC